MEKRGPKITKPLCPRCRRVLKLNRDRWNRWYQKQKAEQKRLEVQTKDAFNIG